MSFSPLLVLYDGHCLLCNRFIRKLISSDTNDILRAAPLQTYAQLENKFDIDESVDSVILVTADSIEYKSDAVLSIKSKFSSIPWFFSGLKLIPKGLRNIVYDFIARNRFSWFGKADECVIPPTEVLEKYLMKTADLQRYLNEMIGNSE